LGFSVEVEGTILGEDWHFTSAQWGF
jgi:hypothetical protein